MSEMVERVARAIAEASGDGTTVVGAKARRQALAAIAEMREPTEGMQDAAREVSGGVPYNPPGREYPKLGYMQTSMLWRAMIDAALAG